MHSFHQMINVRNTLWPWTWCKKTYLYLGTSTHTYTIFHEMVAATKRDTCRLHARPRNVVFYCLVCFDIGEFIFLFQQLPGYHKVTPPPLHCVHLERWSPLLFKLSNNPPLSIVVIFSVRYILSSFASLCQTVLTLFCLKGIHVDSNSLRFPHGLINGATLNALHSFLLALCSSWWKLKSKWK